MSPTIKDSGFYMSQAIQEAHKAWDEGEIPVGAVIVYKDKVIARGHNRVEASKDPTAHAEILVIGAAAASLDNWRLEGCSLYVTLEPCPMCAGAVINAKLPKVIYGAQDPRLGACSSALSLFDLNLLDRTTVCEGAILADECAALLKNFFQELRKK